MEKQFLKLRTLVPNTLISGCIKLIVIAVIAYTSFTTTANAQPTFLGIDPISTFEEIGYVSFKQKHSYLSCLLLAQAESWEPVERNSKNRGFWAWLTGAGRRGSCSNLITPLISLTPATVEVDQGGKNQDDIAQGVALTASLYPNFWFYIPHELQEIEYAEFMIQDENGKDLLEKPLLLFINQTGIISFQWPKNGPELEIGRPYHWYFSILCDLERASRNLSVDDWIERIRFDESLVTDIPFNEKLRIYSEANIWHETITVLATEICDSNSPRDILSYWDILLSGSLRNLSGIDLPKELEASCSSQRQLTAI